MIMKYIKVEAPFSLEEGKKSQVQVFKSEPGKTLDVRYIKALMLPSSGSDKMVLTSDIKCLLPYPSRGAVIDRSHKVDFAGVEELHIEASAFDELVKEGKISAEGVYLTVKEKVVESEPEAPVATEPKTVEHELSEENLANNPELKEEGLEAGKKIEIEITEEPVAKKTEKVEEVEKVEEKVPEPTKPEEESVDTDKANDGGENDTATDPASA